MTMYMTRMFFFEHLQFLFQDIAAIKKNQEVLQAKLAMKKNMESRKIENMNKIKEISKGKQELLEKQMAEQKKLISMIEEKKESMKPEERAMVMGLIKNLADQISKTKEDLQKLVLSSNKRSAADVSFLSLNFHQMVTILITSKTMFY